MKPTYAIKFFDGSLFFGGTSYYETRWTEIPRKQIKQLIYNLPDGNNLVLNNAEEFYHFVEVVTNLNGINKGDTTIEYVYLLTRKEDKVISYRINIKKDIQGNTGSISRKEFKANNEWICKLNEEGWR